MRRLRIILIEPDGKKTDLVEWARFNSGTLGPHELIDGGRAPGHPWTHGPHVAARPPRRRRAAGALIANGEADVLVFFWEPLEVQPHDVDVKALLRLAVLHNVPTACNRATSDYLISSPLFGT